MSKKSGLDVLAGKSDLFRTYYRYAECLKYPQSFANSEIFKMNHFDVKRFFEFLLQKMNAAERKTAQQYLNPETFNFRKVFEEPCLRTKACSEASVQRSDFGQVLSGWGTYTGRYGDEDTEPDLDHNQILQALRIH